MIDFLFTSVYLFLFFLSMCDFLMNKMNDYQANNKKERRKEKRRRIVVERERERERKIKEK